MDNPVAAGLLGILPQSVFLLYAPLGLVGAKTSIRQLILPAVLLTIVVTVTRYMPAMFGWHILVFLLAYVGVVMGFKLTTGIAALASAALSFILIALSDVVVTVPAFQVLGLTFDDVIESWYLYVGFTWLESIILIVFSLIVKYRSFVLIPIADSRRLSGGTSDRP